MAKINWGKVYNAIRDIAPIAIDIYAGLEEGRDREVTQGINQGDAELRRYLASLQGQNLDLQRQRFNLDAPDTLAGQSVRGDVMANAQDATIGGLPSYIRKGKVSGGLRPSLMSPQSRQFGKEMTRQALLKQMQLKDGGGIGAGTALPTGGGVGVPRSLPSGGGASDAGTGSGVAGTIGGVVNAVGTSIAPDVILPGLGLVASSPLFQYESNLPDSMEATSYGAKVKGSPGYGPGAVSTGSESFIIGENGEKILTHGNTGLLDEEDVEDAGFGEGMY